MKYRHSFHAGNFADVHKHVALVALITTLQRKDSGFLYLETHAGRGLYDFGGADSRHGAEAKHGIGALRATRSAAAEIDDYLGRVQALRDASGLTNAYPGSPLLAAHALRAQDRGVCCEVVPPECRALERALGGFRRMRAECEDGFQRLTAYLPPQERRALVLIDPPYEDPAAELAKGLAAIEAILQRLANAVIALWYPIKDERTLAPWLGRVERALAVPTLISELWLHPRDSHVALNGSGMLFVNPPYQFDERMAVWLPELGHILGTDGHGGTAQRWIVHERN